MSDERFQIGDVVTRDGTDRHRVIATNDDHSQVHVECVKEPSSWLSADGVRDKPWCRIGDRKWDLASRYDYPESLLIDLDRV